MIRKLHVCNNMFNHFCTSRHVSLTFKDATDPSDCLKGKTTKEARLRLWHNLGLILKKVSGSLIYYQYFEHLYFHKIFGYIINYCTLIFENVLFVIICYFCCYCCYHHYCCFYGCHYYHYFYFFTIVVSFYHYYCCFYCYLYIHYCYCYYYYCYYYLYYFYLNLHHHFYFSFL